MSAWTETGCYRLGRLYEDVEVRTPKFLAFRKVRCVRNDYYVVGLWFSGFGHRLLNPDALDCPICGLEGCVVG